MSFADRWTAAKDSEGKKYLTDNAILDWTRPPDVVLVHSDGRRHVMKTADLVSLTRFFREPDEAALAAEIERLLATP